jgi:hypothetical protein
MKSLGATAAVAFVLAMAQGCPGQFDVGEVCRDVRR